MKSGDSSPYFTFTGHATPVQVIAASRNGEWLASGSTDGEVIIWNPSRGNSIRRLPAQP